MIPKKLLNIINDLFKKTEDGDLIWSYNSDLSTVYSSFDDRKIEISYRFNEIYEEGQFNIKIEKDDDERYFDVRLSEDYYESVKALYDSAQASDL